MTACQETFGAHMSMVNGHNKSLLYLEPAAIMRAQRNAGRIDGSEKCVKMIFQKVLTTEKIALKTKVNKEGASAQLQN